MKKRILLVSCFGLGRGGVQNVLMTIVRNLSNKYIFDILIFSPDVRFYEEEFASYGGNIYRVPHYAGSSSLRRKLDHFFRIPRIYKATRKILKENGPYQAIHCNNYFESAYCLLAARLCNIPVRICHMHDALPEDRGIYRLLVKINLKIIALCANYNLACSKEASLATFGNDKAEIFLNSYNNKIFDIDKYQRHTAETLHLVQIGSFSDKKNQLFSLDVLHHLRQFIPDAKLTFVGFDIENYQSKMEQRMIELDLQNSVSILPHDTNIPELLTNVNLSLIPSKYEGFGIVAIESQAMGVPVFASTALPESTNAGGCTYLSLDLGADIWASTIKDWYLNNKNKTFKFECTNYEENNVLQKYKELYESR